MGLFPAELPAHELVEIDPARISLHVVPQARIVGMQRLSSHAVWRPAPGRKGAFEVRHRSRPIGLMFLSSPVIALAVRDEFLALPTAGRGIALRQVADMSVCVGLQPLAWHWNIGKLVALLATSHEVARAHMARYGDELKWITTTSLYGRGAQYNRLYRFLGYTKGFGHQHISDDEYHEMLDWMRREGVQIPSSSFGAGSNPRMRRIAAYQRAAGQAVNLHHGNRRGVYISAANVASVADLAQEWFARWGQPRYERTKSLTPPYVDGLAGTA